MLKFSLNNSEVNVWFSSDLHLGHKNIIKYENRPFQSIKEHDDVLIDNWNRCVKKQDIVVYLGDFALTSLKEIDRYIQRVNGKIYLILGNHDKSIKQSYHLCDIQEVGFIDVNIQKIWLSHYAHKVWPNCHYGSWHLYGHSHGNLLDDPKSLSMDVGVDAIYKRLGSKDIKDYRPISFSEVKEILSKKIFVPVDHHK